MRKLLILVPLLAGLASGADQPWSQKKAVEWYGKQPWLVGSNYITSNAINQLEMWQADSFDAQRIDTELGWAEGIGMNTMRVFLHDLLWQQDAPGFQKRINTFLEIAHKHHIRPLFVIFDSCWDPNPQLGKQRDPKPGVHNSGWVQSPGIKALSDKAEYPRLEAYVKGVVGAFANDKRILGWDLWNEPDNRSDSSYGDPAEKTGYVETLLPQVFTWARAANPTQPLTSGVWTGDWSSLDKMSAVARIQITQSDVISFHSYDPAPDFQKRIDSLRQFGRPLMCTEYMARPRGSTFATILPVAKTEKVAAYNWGFVQGKTQTNMPWDSWQHPYVDHPPEVWFHDVFYGDGRPYRAAEVELIEKMTGRGKKKYPMAA